MIAQRLQNVGLALVGLMLPLVIACVLILFATKRPEPAQVSEVRTPNPAKAPWYVFGLGDYLVAADPWFAGTAWIWVVPGIFVLAGFLLWVLLRWPTVPQHRRLGALAAYSLGAGFLFALPWYWGLIALVANRQS